MPAIMGDPGQLGREDYTLQERHSWRQWLCNEVGCVIRIYTFSQDRLCTSYSSLDTTLPWRLSSFLNRSTEQLGNVFQQLQSTHLTATPQHHSDEAREGNMDIPYSPPQSTTPGYNKPMIEGQHNSVNPQHNTRDEGTEHRPSTD